MSLEHLNITLFQYINAPISASNFDIHLAIFLAKDTLYLLAIFLLAYWAFGQYTQKSLALKAMINCAIALLVGYLISLVYPHPRPFVLGVGQNLIEHAATYSFPSNHMLIFSSVLFSFLLAKKYAIAIILGATTFLMAWSRIYVGVHFPFDMFGALMVTACCSYVVHYVWPYCQGPIMHYSLYIYHLIFRPFIHRGWLSK
ncbi:undecaprenyl-diphosphatase [Acinetobacter larvae]|uniref:undecaprenyl-diphosphate phosphatase n=1 Tax=Acinetobacter larvae TaxID=1789224 RepID=A0A1B2LYS4_9GAMM|nr:undecaprenyl-diphosphatase [Acinetobacter larvae]AOA58112.1 undecaprenyl-diphosphatase [Acinetobacter larvae]